MYVKIISICKYCTWLFISCELLQNRDKGTLMQFHPIICSGLNFKKKKEFAVPHVVHSELKRTVCNSRETNEDKGLMVRPQQFLVWKRTRQYPLFPRMLCVTNDKCTVKENMPPARRWPQDLQGVLESMILFVVYVQNVNYRVYVTKYECSNGPDQVSTYHEHLCSASVIRQTDNPKELEDSEWYSYRNLAIIDD